MIRSYLRFLILLLAASALAPLITLVASGYIQHRVPPWSEAALYLLVAVGTIPLAAGLRWFLSRPEVERAASDQAAFLTHELPDRWVGLAILASAALSLFLELAIIRWQATVFPFFAFYKNLSLLSCFAGLGLGYSLGRKDRVPLFLTLPLLCWQFLLMLGMRYGMSNDQFQSLNISPFREQLHMGLFNLQFYFGLQTYFVLAIVFLLTALAFIPLGQLCSCVLERRDKLTGYGLNLIGSLAGVLLMFAASAFWTPPSLWFLIAFAILLCFQVPKRSVIAVGVVSAALALLILEWPVSPEWQRIYSPYQLIEVGSNKLGLLQIRVSGQFYQRVYNLAKSTDATPANLSTRNARDYYGLPYQIVKHPKYVAIVGAGTGNDVAAALRSGAEHVDAIEIDPAILFLGRQGHPEHPYDDPRVQVVVNDARSFLRETDHHYDLIVFGLLDSHTLLSQASSVRLDSFVYTLEAMREARARLTPQGVISLAFCVLNDQLGRKIYLMLQDAFDGQPPLCIRVRYDAGVVFLEPEGGRMTMPPDLLSQEGFSDITATYANSSLHADVSTDDWPFFYMPERIYPLSYLLMVGLILILSLALTAAFVPGRPRAGSVIFFLLGAGFMLVETKNITELGLIFSNSWQVVGLVIAGIMVMAWGANLVVQRLEITGTAVPYGLLLVSLFLGWWMARSGGLPSTWPGRISTSLLLTSPLFFSGIIFSILLKGKVEISGAMAANLFGAMCGGLLEYNSMYFGFHFLYLIAAGLYASAFTWELVRSTIDRTVIVA